MSNPTKTPPQSLPSLLASAAQKGTISPATSALLTGNLGAVVIAGAAGKDAEDIGSKRRASDCERIRRDLLASEHFTLAFVGVAVQAQATPSAIRTPASSRPDRAEGGEGGARSVGDEELEARLVLHAAIAADREIGGADAAGAVGAGARALANADVELVEIRRVELRPEVPRRCMRFK